MIKLRTADAFFAKVDKDANAYDLQRSGAKRGTSGVRREQS
jgi:hypothetical protein